MRLSLFILCFFVAYTLEAQQSTLPKETLISEVAVATIKVEGYPDFLASDGDGVWITNTNRVEKFRVGDKNPVMSVSIPAPCGAMATGFGSLWVVSCAKKSLYRIDALSGEILAVIETGIADPEGELSIAVGAGSVWLLTNAQGELSRIDPYKNEVAHKIKVAPSSFAAVFGFNAVWITNTASNSVQRIDPVKGKVITTIPVGATPRFLAAGLNGVWTLNQTDGTISKIDPMTNTLQTTIAAEVPGSGGDIAVGSKNIFVRAKNTMLTVIDPPSNAVIKRYGPPSGSGAVRVENGRVWITAHDINTIWIVNE